MLPVGVCARLRCHLSVDGDADLSTADECKTRAALARAAVLAELQTWVARGCFSSNTAGSLSA
eukprot:3130504-Lingulodinium_polyedra.AAC.1